MRFDKILKAWADHFNMTLKDFMQKAGYSQQMYYNYRNRPNAKPYASTVYNFATTYSISFESFLKGPQK